MIDSVTEIDLDLDDLVSIPLFYEGVPAGEAYEHDELNGYENLLLPRHFARNSDQYQSFKINGYSMAPRLIDGDIVIADISEEARNSALVSKKSKIVIVDLDKKRMCKRLQIKENGDIYLISNNPDYEPIFVESWQELYIVGVMTHFIGNQDDNVS